MKELSLLQIKQTELVVLRQFDAFCKNNNIRYFLSNGTLLGAVKYQGFIPWDDDVDVLVPRADYDRLMREFPEEGPLKLLCSERDETYVFPFAKLSDTTTRMTHQTTLKDYSCGVHIDIFPLDTWHEDLNVAKKQARALQGLVQGLAMSIAQFSKGRTFLRTCVKTGWIAAAHLIGHKRIRARLNKEIARVKNGAGENYCGCVAWSVYGEREVIPKEVFSDTIPIEFEGETFPAPIGYDTYLRSLYGDYEKDPPKKDQKTHHRFQAFFVTENNR